MMNPTMSTINKLSLLNRKVIIHHRKNTETPTLEGIITEINQKGSATITLPNKTSLTMDLNEAIRALIRKTRADITLTAMDSNGRLKHMQCTRVEPFANPEGKTAEERGATRYLGAYMSFQGWDKKESLQKPSETSRFKSPESTRTLKTRELQFNPSSPPEWHLGA